MIQLLEGGKTVTVCEVSKRQNVNRQMICLYTEEIYFEGLVVPRVIQRRE